MESSPLLDREKIKRLFETLVDFPDYKFRSKTYPGENVELGERLDNIVNAANKLMLMRGSSHLHPAFQTQTEKAHYILDQELLPLVHTMRKISKDRENQLPFVTNARDTFTKAYNVFNPDDSYGQFAQSVLERAAQVLELGDISKAVPQQGITR